MSWFEQWANSLHTWAAAEVESRFPTHASQDDPPPRAGLVQLVGLAVFLTAPVAIWLFLDWLSKR